MLAVKGPQRASVSSDGEEASVFSVHPHIPHFLGIDNVELQHHRVWQIVGPCPGTIKQAC
jgi:hypothetical protein